eukprot:TRINITY_DN1285_c3_g1_i1.p1 TRINITY_DN1285_c3_g1~~TRINITY_DN1285_c3_g1_i1.p1  ORF type:complete len:251 (+),score=-13.16 TRINITY_DN1285_c3_g1_i1:858-1610(+)
MIRYSFKNLHLIMQYAFQPLYILYNVSFLRYALETFQWQPKELQMYTNLNIFSFFICKINTNKVLNGIFCIIMKIIPDMFDDFLCENDSYGFYHKLWCLSLLQAPYKARNSYGYESKQSIINSQQFKYESKGMQWVSFNISKFEKSFRRYTKFIKTLPPEKNLLFATGTHLSALLLLKRILHTQNVHKLFVIGNRHLFINSTFKREYFKVTILSQIVHKNIFKKQPMLVRKLQSTLFISKSRGQKISLNQ